MVTMSGVVAGEFIWLAMDRCLRGRPKMTGRRGCRLALSIGVSGLFLALGIATTAEAQGFGPDPFRPYVNQYDPYTYPMGPAGPGAGGSGPVLPRSGLFGANQYQRYLDSLGGAAAAD